MTRLGALVLKSFRLATSYRLNFFARWFVWVFVVIWAYFMGRVFARGDGVAGLLGMDYFTFTLVGICFQQFLLTGLMTFASNLREEMLMGTLEPLLATPASERSVLLGGSIWNLMEACWSAAIMLGVGWCLGADFERANVLGVAVIIILALAALASWGILSASVVIVFKKADPVGWGMYALSYLLSGVYFPIQELPGWLQPVCYVFPLTYAIQGVRDTLVLGKGLVDILWVVGALAAYAAVLIPLSLVCFRRAVRHARTTGSLLHY